MIGVGRVRAVRDGGVEIDMPAVALGAMVRIAAAPESVCGRVIATDRVGAYVVVRGTLDGVAVGARVCEDLAGGRIATHDVPLVRAKIDAPLWTGVRAIDALLTIGRGARVGIFGGPGLGKSVLLETILNGARADAVVLALVGERGREAQRWAESCDARVRIVCATSDRTAMERVDAAESAFACAESYARRGLHVLVLMDSLARFALARRDVALASGESVGRAGYPPSVFSAMARLVERAGSFAVGSISLIATVLSDGDDRDPVSEAARSLLDGHIALSPRLAQAGWFPAIDVPMSLSRTMPDFVDPDHGRAAASVRSALARLDEVRETRSLGIDPTDPATLRAIAAESLLAAFLRQGRAPEPPRRMLEALVQTADTLEEPYEHHV